ncbi:hypothetical protein NKH77_48315 [Streptomyces sp. M19]
MRFTISRAREEDLRRAEELTVRTNQLNTTGYTYSYEELDALRRSPTTNCWSPRWRTGTARTGRSACAWCAGTPAPGGSGCC